jgi:hypothetical protein
LLSDAGTAELVGGGPEDPVGDAVAAGFLTAAVVTEAVVYFQTPDSPTTSPGDDWYWKGSGDPESQRGEWRNRITNEKLHPDFNHGEPFGPHWDYKRPGQPKVRVPPGEDTDNY